MAAVCAAPAALHAQFDFRIDGRPVQVHGFAAQGFVYSNNNNYLTMDTSEGSFAMTDGGVNISAPVTDKFRVGAQAYARNIGQLGRGHVTIDWAFGDYKFKSWFGIRAGKVKTALGLFNDTQDMEFLHTWAILPQSLYPLDLRAATIAHTGADVYGEIRLRKIGSLNYTVYYGLREHDTRGGFYYGAAGTGDKILSLSGKTVGADLRWTTPIQGLMLGGSWADQTEDLSASVGRYGNALLTASNPQRITSAYGDYARGHWHFNGEYRRTHDVLEGVLLGTTVLSNQSETGWFLTAAYRVTKRLELGMYHSRYYVDAPHVASPAAEHIFDHTVTARFDIARWWNVKIEGHFIDGYGDAYSAHGFYARSNPNGLNPTTNMFVIRTGFNM
jgi:hypothetical protein